MADIPLKSLTFPDLTDTYTIPVQSVNGQTGDVNVNTVYIGSSAPTDPDVNVWIDTSGDSDVSYIPLPPSATSGQFLVYNGSAWVAQTLSTWQGGSY